MSTEKTTHKLYNGSISIDFYPNSHRYKKVGERTYLIGVTTACGMLDKSRPLLIWSSELTRKFLFEKINAGETVDTTMVIEACDQYNVKRDTAADTGTQIHNWIEQYVKGSKPEIPEDQKVANGVMAFLDWVEKNEVKILQSERLVYSKEYGYVGTLDAVAEVNGKKYILDFKSSKGIYETMLYQTAAYLKAWNEEHGDNIVNRYILKLGKEDGEFQAESFENLNDLQKDFECFKSLLFLKQRDKDLYQWKRSVNR